MTTPIYLVRHAKAGSRARWVEPDHLRPLTKPGRRQAKALVALFAEQPISRLVSSPYIRCVETLEPLAVARNLEIELAEELGEGAGDALELMLSIAADGPAALSTHGDVMQLSVGKLVAMGTPLSDGDQFDLAKGSTWIVDVDGGAFTEARYMPPPETQDS